MASKRKYRVIKSSCRVCNSYRECVDLFETKIDSNHMPLHEAYSYVTNLEISEEDGFSRTICYNCVDRLGDAYFFKEQSLNNYKTQLEKRNEVQTSTFEIELLNEEPENLAEQHTNEDTIESNVEDTVEDAVEFLVFNDVTSSVTVLSNKKKYSESEKKHECQVCEKRFLRKSNLMDHLRLHANVKPYKCEICERSFVQIGNFRAHLRTHTNEKPYACPICSKSYTQSSALKVHIRSHTNERNYICDVCSKAFTNSSDLGKHKKTHDISQQVKCRFCPKFFAQRANLKLHERNYHSGHYQSHTRQQDTK